MKINKIVVDGVKGRHFSIDVTGRNLLLGGPMGAGKSAVLTAVRLALLLPTEFGSNNLDRLSPNGCWFVQIRFDDERQTWIERSHANGKNAYKVNGINQPLEAYAKVIKSVIDVEPHHVDLDAFLGLSGQKRADLFASLLESSKERLVPVVESLAKVPLSDDLKNEWKDVAGTPAELVEFIKAAANDAAKELRDAKTNLDCLIQKQQAPLAHGLNPAEAKAKVQEIDERIGALKGRKGNYDQAREQYESADDLAIKADEDAIETQAAVTSAQVMVDSIPKTESTLKDRELRLQEATAQRDAAAKALDYSKSKSAELARRRDQASQARQIIGDLLRMEWEVPRDWMTEEFAGLCNDIEILDVPVVDDETHKRLVAFAREVVTEAMGGEPKIIEKHIVELNASIRSLDAEIEAGKSELSKAELHLIKMRSDRDAAQKDLVAAQRVQSSIDDLRAKAESKRQRALELRQQAQRLAPRDDVAQIDGEISALGKERSEIQKRITELEERHAISGQVEDQRVEVLRLTEELGLLQILLKELQKWRDERIETSMQAIIGPFQETFKTIFDEATILHEISGTGRATRFEFMMLRRLEDGRGERIPFDLLSDGETVLVALAFLAALQKIKTGPGSIITMNSEPLDTQGFLRLIEAAPKLGLDAILIADNGADGILQYYGTQRLESWQYLNLGNVVPA